MHLLKKILPSLCTLANLVFGLVALVMLLNEQWDWAGVYIVAGMLFDGFDGRLARFLGVSSEFGKQLDSLSDLVTFGVAPALLAYAVSLSQFGYLGLIIAFSFTLMGALRLARFNVSSGKADGYFIGLPITLTGGFLALTMMYAAYIPGWIIAVLTLFLAWLMVCTIKYPDFKTAGVSRPVVLAIVAVLIAVVILFKWHASAFFMFPIVIYVLVGIKNYLVDYWQYYRRRRQGGAI
ncbi:MAG: CDP-diacylglycerol--serine O-phosphatidyltransferase [Firmicutes bacterium]|nr:CDP-diacylglycerol--serine O-phosphatidyltransferase [Bacillota bacterium]